MGSARSVEARREPLAMQVEARRPDGCTHGIINTHYDQDPRIFQFFLDPAMKYSPGLFPEGTEDLETAQIKKMHFIAQQLGIEGEERVLDVGCEWGGLVCFLAKEYRCAVVGVTPAPRQADYIRARASASPIEFGSRWDISTRFRLLQGVSTASASWDPLRIVRINPGRSSKLGSSSSPPETSTSRKPASPVRRSGESSNRGRGPGSCRRAHGEEHYQGTAEHYHEWVATHTIAETLARRQRQILVDGEGEDVVGAAEVAHHLQDAALGVRKRETA